MTDPLRRLDLAEESWRDRFVRVLASYLAEGILAASVLAWIACAVWSVK